VVSLSGEWSATGLGCGVATAESVSSTRRQLLQRGSMTRLLLLLLELRHRRRHLY